MNGGSRIDCGDGCVVRVPCTLARVVSFVILVIGGILDCSSWRGSYDEFCDVAVSSDFMAVTQGRRLVSVPSFTRHRTMSLVYGTFNENGFAIAPNA